MSARTKVCQHPGCTTKIAQRSHVCRQHIDWRAVNHPPAQYTLERLCRHCGQPFTIRHSRHFICDPCRTKVCRVCGKSFMSSPTDGVITCSPECSAALNDAPTLTCRRCGKSFTQRQGKATKYCGDECRYLAARHDESTLAAMKRRSWRYKQWRSAVFTRDGYTCQQCGATEHLHAHHIQPWETHPDLAFDIANGKTLCAPCHSIIHGARVPLRGAKRTTCAHCGKVIKGQGRTGLCRSCGMRNSPKFWASQAKRQRDASGHFSPAPVLV